MNKLSKRLEVVASFVNDNSKVIDIGCDHGLLSIYLVNKYKKSSTTINNGIQNAIIYAWRITPPDDLIKYYTARINLDTGIPTPMEFIYYYVNKIKKKI